MITFVKSPPMPANRSSLCLLSGTAMPYDIGIALRFTSKSNSVSIGEGEVPIGTGPVTSQLSA